MGVDLLVREAQWLRPDGNFGRGHLVAARGVVDTLGPDDSVPEGVPILEGRGLLALPGAIDAHTHFRQPGQAYKEGIANGSKAALKGGVTTVLDMPNNVPPCTTVGRLSAKRALFARRSLVNWGLHVLAVPRLGPPPLPHASGKIYMAQSCAEPAAAGEALGRIVHRWSRVTVHAEDEATFLPLGPAAPHHLRRPRGAIIRALDALGAALDSGGDAARVRAILCHVSTADEVRWIQERKARGFDVWAETCPHYFLLTQDDYLREGPRLQVNPPLREEADKWAILEGVADGTIDFVSSDHAPHTQAEKASSCPPSGVPGIEWLVPALLCLAHRGVITWKRLHEAMCTAQSACFGIRGRDGIMPGNAADIALVGPAVAGRPVGTITRAGYDPFAGLTLGWTVHATVVNGNVMYRDGAVTGSARGREVLS